MCAGPCKSQKRVSEPLKAGVRGSYELPGLRAWFSESGSRKAACALKFKIYLKRTSKIVQWVNMFATKPDNLSLIPGILGVERGSQLPHALHVTSTHTLWPVCHTIYFKNRNDMRIGQRC